MKAYVCLQDGCYVVDGATALRTSNGVLEILGAAGGQTTGELVAAVTGETLVVLGDEPPEVLELLGQEEEEEEEENGG